jgi:hypothetical protein
VAAGVEPRGFQPTPSAVQRRHNSLLEVAGGCKIPANTLILYVNSFPDISGDLLGLLHRCCTDVTVCIRTRSGMIVIRPATWRPLLRGSSWVSSATFIALCSCGVREHHLCSEALTALEHILVPQTNLCCARRIASRCRVKSQDSYLPSS